MRQGAVNVRFEYKSVHTLLRECIQTYTIEATYVVVITQIYIGFPHGIDLCDVAVRISWNHMNSNAFQENSYFWIAMLLSFMLYSFSTYSLKKKNIQ